MSRRAPLILAGLLFLLALAPAASAAEGGEAGLGGGSDLRAGTVIDLTQGASVPPVHFLFADNPAPRPIEIRFRTDAPPGITISPQRRRAALAPDERVEVRFGIKVASSLAPGRYSVNVQLVRSDIEAKPGQVTHLPAIGTQFVIRVVGTSAAITVKALSATTGTPVEGTLVLSAVQRNGRTFAVDRTLGSTLTARVGPGLYEGAFLLGEQLRTAKRVRVRAGGSAEIELRVETVTFVVASAKPVLENEKPVVANLVASVQNQLGPIEEPATLRARVLENGRELESITLAELPTLPEGFSEGKETYRPAAGWRPGSSYRFIFELVTPEYTLTASEKPTITTAASSSTLPLSLPIILAATAALGLAAVAAAATVRRRGRMRIQHRAGLPEPVEQAEEEPTTAPPDVAIDDDAIARRAYEISRRADAGTPEENWQRAERELRGA